MGYRAAQDALDDFLHLLLDLRTWPGASWLPSVDCEGCMGPSWA